MSGMEKNDEIRDEQKSEETIPSPPSYEEAMASSQSSGEIQALQGSGEIQTPQGSEEIQIPQTIITYHDLGVALQNLKVETGAQNAEILYMQENVQIYFISPDGSVTAPQEPETLKIFILEHEDSDNNPKAFLQVGGWIYPLVPGVSPCYRIDKDTFILPDVHSTVAGSSVGLVFPKEAGDSAYELLDDILEGIVTRKPPTARKRVARHIKPTPYASTISQGIVSGAHSISNGLIRGAQKASEFMNYGTPKLIDKITPEPVPRVVNPRVNRGLEVAKNVTGTAVRFTGFVATQIGHATMGLGRFLAPHIQSQGTRLLTSTCSLTQQEASEKMDNALELAAGAVEGFSTVYEGLENSAGILASSLANNTVKIVEHKYGTAFGEATGESFKVMGNVFVAGQTVRHLTPKGLVKVTAKATGKAVVEDYRNSLREDRNNFGGPGSSGTNL